MLPENSDRQKPYVIGQFVQIPAQYKKRNCTDVCCLITGIAFSIAILTAAAVLFNKSTFYKVNFPTDSDGKLCGYDYPDYQYLFFSNAPLIKSARVCVSKCPSKGDITLNCKPNSLVSTCNFNPLNKYYDSYAQRTRMGFFCYPTNEVMKATLSQIAKLTGQEDFFNSLDSIKTSLIVALGLSFVYFIIVWIFPRVMNYLIIALSIISMLVLIVKTFGFQTKDTAYRTIVAIIQIIVVAIIVVSLYKNIRSIRIHAILLKHASSMIYQRCFTLLYIIIYLVFFCGLIGLVLFEFVGFWTNGRAIFLPLQYIYYQLEGITVSPLTTVLLSIQFVWGAGFLKQSYNYCISGNAVSWYFGKLPEEQFQEGTFYPFRLQLVKNLGSVIGCSFVTTFFSIFDLLFDILKPTDKSGIYNKICGCFCGLCYKIWDLVRSDAMSFIVVNGNPYCNSARYCQYLCDKSLITQYSQSCSRIYRIASHFFIASLTLLYSVFMTQNKSIFAFIIILVGSLIVSTFFISIHADAAQAIQIVYLLDQEYIHRGENQMKHNREGLGLATKKREIAQQIAKQYNEAQNKEQNN